MFLWTGYLKTHSWWVCFIREGGSNISSCCGNPGGFPAIIRIHVCSDSMCHAVGSKMPTKPEYSMAWWYVNKTTAKLILKFIELLIFNFSYMSTYRRAIFGSGWVVDAANIHTRHDGVVSHEELHLHCKMQFEAFKLITSNCFSSIKINYGPVLYELKSFFASDWRQTVIC